MTLINNVRLHSGDSKDIALAFHDPTLELGSSIEDIATLITLKPLLEKDYNPTTAISSKLSQEVSSMNNTPSLSPTFVASPDKTSKILEGHFENIRDNLEVIKKIINELANRGEFFLGLRSKDGKTHYIKGEEWNEFEDKFINSTQNITKAVNLIRESIKKLRNTLSKNAKYPALDKIEEYCKNLLDKIPKPSSKWDVDKATYDGLKWEHESINDEKFTVFWDWSKWFKDVKNPVGLLEMVLDKDTSRKDDYLDILSDGQDSVDELLANVGKYSRMLKRENILKHFKGLSTEEAYMYLITTVLPMLQEESTMSLEEQGNTMKLISGVFDKWNSIQNLINKAIQQNQQDAVAADKLGNQIKSIVQDIQYQLRRARMYLPASAESLLNTMKELSNKLITEYPKDFFRVAKDSDQTVFKAYMDNLGQGITALTSISNMTQQQLQIDTQYYNSLLGFQKSAQDSINKIIQTALNNTRP